MQKVKVTVYIDGFNLYHSINALKKNYLKWLHVRQLAATFLRPVRRYRDEAGFRKDGGAADTRRRNYDAIARPAALAGTSMSRGRRTALCR